MWVPQSTNQFDCYNYKMPYINESFASRLRNKKASIVREVRYPTEGQKIRIKIESSAKWKRLRRWFFIRNPICVDPLSLHDRPVPTQEIHHLIPVEDNPSRALDGSNLAALCSSCHRSIESLVSKGEATHHLFPAPNLD